MLQQIRNWRVIVGLTCLAAAFFIALFTRLPSGNPWLQFLSGLFALALFIEGLELILRLSERPMVRRLVSKLSNAAVIRKMNGILVGTLFAIALAALVLGHLMEFNLLQVLVFAVSLVLFACWLFEVTGSTVGFLTENRGVRIIVCLGFVAALFLGFTDVASSGSLIPERPLSFIITLLPFLPYGLRSLVDLIWP